MEKTSPAETTALLAFQLGIILFMVRFFGRLAKRFGIPRVFGELLAGALIGPYALGSVRLPGFPEGIFPPDGGALALSPGLYAVASIAAIILLFTLGLETDIHLFLRCSLAGGVIGTGGAALSFVFGDLAGALLMGRAFTDPVCLFLGILSTATSAGIAARILSDQKKMDSPEGVTILTAAVFDEVLGLIALAAVLGIVTVTKSASGAPGVFAGAGKAFGIWLGFTALGLIFSGRIAAFLKLFKRGYDFSVLALGIAMILAGIFGKLGLAMITGAYIAGLSLSKTGIAAAVRERIRGMYEFFVPVFFAVTGMMVNAREIISAPVLIFGALFTAAAVTAKMAGCGGLALLLGFNGRGALRIGAGMVPRGELALVIAGTGLAAGILDQKIFGAVILMTLITALASPPLLSAFLRLSGSGARKPVRNGDTIRTVWEFNSGKIAGLVTDTLLEDLKRDGFYVRMMNIDDGLSQARKDDISLSITEEKNRLSIETAKPDMPFVKAAVYEVIAGLSGAVQKLKDSSDPRAARKDLTDEKGAAGENLLSLIDPETVRVGLKGETKEEIITELIDILAAKGKLSDRDTVLKDVLEREKTMSTGMKCGVALPHAKTGGAGDLAVSVGVKKEGVDFESIDGEKSRLFILVVSPKNVSGPHIRFLAAIAGVLKDSAVREAAINAESPEELAGLLRK